MPTELLNKEHRVEVRHRIWPELETPPPGIRVPLMPKIRPKLPRGITCRLVSNPPATVWPLVWDAISEFGLANLYIYAPKEAFEKAQVDPAIVAERKGNLYLIAVWG